MRPSVVVGGVVQVLASLCVVAGATTAVAQPVAPPPVDERLLFAPIESVTTASRFEQPVDRAPASVTIVTGEEIRRHGHRSLADVLHAVRGFYSVDDHNYVTLGVRGLARPGDFNTRVLLLLDGRRLNDPVFDSALLGTEGPVDMELIERVEIVRGPSSSVYGANGLFAVINVVTRRGRDVAGVEGGVLAGSLGSYGVRGAWGRRGTVETLVSASWQDSDGASYYFPELDDPATGHGISAKGMDGDRAARAFAKASWRDLTLLGAWSWREKRVPTGAYGVLFNDDRTRTTDDALVLDLRWTPAWRADHVTEARAFYNHSGYEGTYAYDEGDGASSLLRDGAHGARWGAEFQHTLPVAGRHRWLWGAELRHDFDQDQWIDAPGLRFDGRRSSWGASLFAQDELSLSSRLTLNLGGRLDWYESFGVAVNPRLGLIVQAGGDSVLKLLYGRAFRAPNAYELEYDDGVTQRSNPALRPETIQAWEAGWQRPLGGSVRGSLSAYYYRLSDLASQHADPVDGRLVFVNAGPFEAPGVEAEIEARTPGGTTGRASWAFSRVRRVGEDDVHLSNSPTHLGKLQVSGPLAVETVTGGLELLYTGTRRTLSGGTAGRAAQVNATVLVRRPGRGLQGTVAVRNLLDTAHVVPGGEEHVQDVLPQRGRTLHVEVRYGF